jgi:hypothetical protein
MDHIGTLQMKEAMPMIDTTLPKRKKRFGRQNDQYFL